ncbi:hypothetical protein [Demequina aestuarii]|uniref:hypothetical protein n=1 Tax=Demequina aestuarii TaxID=327095 RepID=UPI000784D336|nr:hypothetical protein [Demequina aestuarii]
MPRNGRHVEVILVDLTDHEVLGYPSIKRALDDLEGYDIQSNRIFLVVQAEEVQAVTISSEDSRPWQASVLLRPVSSDEEEELAGLLSLRALELGLRLQSRSVPDIAAGLMRHLNGSVTD